VQFTGFKRKVNIAGVSLAFIYLK